MPARISVWHFFTVPSYATNHIHVHWSKSAEIVLHCIYD